jgi:hypothetical protein
VRACTSRYSANPLGVEAGRRRDLARERRYDLAPLLHGREDGRQVERGILAQDGLLELAQRGARLQPQLLVECRARVLVAGESVGLPARAVEGEHELTAQALAVGVLGDEGLELRNQRDVVAELELGVDQILAGDQAQLLEAQDLGRGERLVGEVGERRAAPQGERCSQCLRALLHGVQSAGLSDLALEAHEIDLLGLDVQGVAIATRLNGVFAELFAQLRDVVVQRVARRLRGLCSPELLDQHVSGHPLVPTQEQKG